MKTTEVLHKISYPLNNKEIVDNCMDKQKVTEILGYELDSYRILYFNGNWSPWYIYGENDLYHKTGEPERRYVACFNDHVFEAIGKITKE